MKLNNKILISNTMLSILMFALISVGMYLLVSSAIYDELDNHLMQHKADILGQVQEDPTTFDAIMKLGGLGSYEWVEFSPYDSSIALNSTHYSTIDTVRNGKISYGLDEYRRLETTITVANTNYILSIYEEVAAWNNISSSILLSVLAGLLIWVILLYVVNQVVFDRILTPFYDTIDKLGKISTPTQLEVSFPASTTEEINVLNKALNTMMTQIRSSFEDQKKFIQNASHELLTPLSIIRQKAEKILSKSEDQNRETLESANEIQQMAVRLSRLSNALLTISRVENKQFAMDEKVDIEGVAEKVLNELHDFIEIKGMKITKEFEVPLVIEGSEELLHSALYNIMQNAIKFSPEKGEVRIGVKQDPNRSGRGIFFVSDEGPGIPKDMINEVFDRFKKGSNAQSGYESTPGLGLSIVQSICLLHGFQCEASNNEKKGAKISIHF